MQVCSTADILFGPAHNVCRGPSQAELRVGSPIIATTDGPRSEELVVIPNRTSNPNTHSPQRAYQFDQVFGADADQSIIYQDVVVPILNEVFDGYNATLCAYGQTGTGKTCVNILWTVTSLDFHYAQVHYAWRA
jgi:hypothetical protein